MNRRPLRRAATFAGALVVTATAFVGLGADVASAADKVIIFYTQCDEMSTTATVKVKRINEDGTNAITIGDTGIAHCGDDNSATPAVFHTGFVAIGEYGYFGWQKSDDSGTGVGRIKLDGSAAAERNWATIPAPAESFQMSPRSIGGYLFGYVDDGYASQYARLNPRVVKIAISSGSVSTAYQPTALDANFPIKYLSFGVGKDSLYVSTDEMANQTLTKVPLTGSPNTSYFTFADVVPDGITMEFLNGGGANLVAESDDTLFLYTRHLTNQKAGISTVQVSALTTSLQVFGAVAGATGQPPADFPVWGGNYLYYKNLTGKQISRTTKTGAVEDNVFTSIVKPGWIHHISPALESAVTLPTTTTTTTTTSTTTTVAATTSSVASATSTTAAATTTTTVAAPTVPKTGGLAPAKIASFLKLQVPKGARVGLSVAATSKSVCAVRSGKLISLKAGNCRVMATVTPKAGKSKRASVTLTTK